MKSFKNQLPDFPRTRHLPWKANGEFVVSEVEAEIIFNSENTYVEEKVDGSFAAIARIDEHPVVRNRQHILKKGYVKKDTSAKLQFRPIWNWYYQNEKFFRILDKMTGGSCAVYGEWLYAVHGMKYDLLPSLFVAFDLYDYVRQEFIDTGIARNILRSSGFTLPPLLHQGPVESWEQLEGFAKGLTPFAKNAPREGVYVKVSEGGFITHRFKMVREGFEQGALWDDKIIQKNVLRFGESDE